MSSLIHYWSSWWGFLVAIAALGLDLTRITILAGAFGLGVGIGLQGVVANFVSGLILLLESRIRVGDSVRWTTCRARSARSAAARARSGHGRAPR